jgi:quinoprotein glucose dehydrogenase
MANSSARPGGRPWILVAVMVALGGWLAVWGGKLASLGGSLYYVLAGVAVLATALLAFRRDARAAWVYAGLTVATIVWALVETGGYPWALLPRIVPVAALGLWFWLPWTRRSLGLGGAAALVGPALFVTSLALVAGMHLVTAWKPATVASRTAPAGTPASTEWTEYGGNPSANRFVAADQINRDNVDQLEVAWTFRTGDAPTPTDPAFAGSTFQNVPLVLDDVMYVCTPHNVVIALDADTGREIWRFDPKADTTGIAHRVCRGVAVHETPGDGACASRLLFGTLDNRLMAIDRRTGRPCADFGVDGAVDIKPGLGEFPRGMYYPTSPPIIAGDLAVMGAFIFDSQTTDAPPGVTRAYDVHTGKLMWAFDYVSPVSIKEPGPDVQFRRGTANYWSVGTYDAELGLIYLPTGNTSPDFYGGHRTPEMEKFASSIVALDAKTGDVRWSYQTVYHDIWDFDIGSQPVLAELDTPAGKVPALYAPTKRGEIFVLDRRTGKPLREVTEKKTPQGAAPGDWVTPTQPFSTGFPSFAPADLRESDMWGATPLDQLWCRIRFKSARYEGQFTPQSLQGSVVYAGSFGVIDWGSVSLDPERGLMIVNTSALPYYQKLIPRDVADSYGVKPYGTAKPGDPPPDKRSFKMFAQKNTPFAIDSFGFLSPLGYPCHQPPWGTMAAIDLKTDKVIWQRPLGTTRDAAPLGLSLPVGVFNLGGTVTTRGGVTFVGGTIDYYLRAFDTETGAELWKGRLPAGAQTNPISYVSGRTGRQYVVTAAGGHGTMRTKFGDHVVAFALPKKD